MAARPKPGRPALPAPIDVSALTTYPMRRRHSKVSVGDFARPWTAGGSFADYLATLPDILAVKTLRAVADAIASAHRRRRPVIVGFGAHVIKVGLAPLLVDLMERGIVTALATNGAGIIHDFELALMGRTSEEVEAEIDSGRFGMAEDTGRLVNQAIVAGHTRGEGMGEAIGRFIESQPRRFRHRQSSVLAAGVRLQVPVTVHVAIGTDIIHMHPSADGAAIGATSLVDFRRLAAVVSSMEGGVYLNVGSAVVLPEVFLKAVSLARNLGHPLTHITTVNMDFLSHYRPLANVVRRPTQKGGHGYSLTGHHEVMLPLLAAMVLERLASPARRRPRA